MKKKLVKTFLPFMAAAAMLTALSGCALFPEEEEALPPPLVEAVDANYFTYNPERGTIENAVSGYASVEAVSSVNVSFPTSNGVFMESYYRLGDTVEAGDVLCETDNSALEEKLRVAEMQYEIDELRYEAAKRRWEAGALDEISWKEAELAIYISRRDIAQLRMEFSTTQLVAPISGQITYELNMAKGAQITEGVTVFTVSDTSEMLIRYTGAGYGKIPINADVTLSFEAKDGSIVEFEATAIQTPDTVPEGSSDKYAVILRPESIPDGVTIGVKLNLYYVIEKSENTLCIRTSSIKSVGDRKYVYVLRDGYRQEQDIVIGLSTDYNTEVLSGLSESDLVIQ
ncbi:MAG: hypothetical protein PUA83_02455 [Clostridiales bacterium]|nr:hypothetical protein [Clostridiales bacterium]